MKPRTTAYVHGNLKTLQVAVGVVQVDLQGARNFGVRWLATALDRERSSVRSIQSASKLAHSKGRDARVAPARAE